MTTGEQVMSDTPRTDAIVQAVDMYVGLTRKDAMAAIDLSRTLERELSAAQAALAEARKVESLCRQAIGSIGSFDTGLQEHYAKQLSALKGKQ